MDIQTIEKALVSARTGGPVAEFFALQDIVTMLAFRGHLTWTEMATDYPPFYDWYVGQLIRLHDELIAKKGRLGTNYQFRTVQNDNLELALLRIRALLDVIPEVTTVKVPVK